MNTDNSGTWSGRVILPLSAAVRGARFSTSKNWQLSAAAREIVDEIHAEVSRASAKVPRPEVIDHAESIILAGNEIFNSLRTGSHVVKQRRTVDLPTISSDPTPLAIADPFETVRENSFRTDAATALAVLNSRPAPRKAPKPLKAPKTASRGALVVGFILAAVTVAALLRVIATGSLL